MEVFVTPGTTFWGSRRVISILTNIWCDMGHEVSLFITASNKPSVYKMNEKINVEYFEAYRSKNVRFTF